MVVEAHKVLKKRRHRHRHFYDQEPQPLEDKHDPDVKPTVIDIFNFLSEKDDDYNTVIKEIAITAKRKNPAENINRSKSCNDILATNIETLDHSPRHRNIISISEVFMNATVEQDSSEKEERPSQIQESYGNHEPAECVRTDNEENGDRCDSENDGIIFTVPTKETTEEESVQLSDGGGTRFTISKVAEGHLLIDKDEKG